jgi:hypothetical protein
MAISYSGEGYKFNPQFANLGALQGLQPLDVTRKAEFQLQPLTYTPIASSRPELVSEGISKGIIAAIGGITEGITAKYKTEQAKGEKLAEREHEIKIAQIKAAPTAAETAYQQQRSDLLAQQIEAAKAKNEADKADDGFNAIPSGATDWSSYNRPNFNQTEDAMTDSAGNVIKPADSTSNQVPAASSATPSQPNVSQRSIFGQSDNPNFVSVRDAIKNRIAASVPAESNLFSDISAITPEPVAEPQLERPFALPIAETSTPRNLPEDKGILALAGEELPLMPVSGAEDKPLAGVTPVEPALPTQQPSEPVLAQAVPETEAEYRYRVESDLTGQPFMNPADARMAKNILEQQLGVKAKVNGIDAGKGKRIYRVEIVEDAPSKTAPEGYFIESIRDADGKETYVYKPKILVKQQIATFDNNIDKARVLKKTLEKIEKIAPSYFGITGGAGGISGLMKYNPISNDARTTRALLDTVKGIVGFDELVALKAQGGSLGALSDSELKMLTSLQGSVDPDMDEATFLENIKSMRESTERLISNLETDKKEVMKVESPTKFQPIQTPENRVEIKTQAEFNALKSGQKFIFNGRPGTK